MVLQLRIAAHKQFTLLFYFKEIEFIAIHFRKAEDYYLYELLYCNDVAHSVLGTEL